jgi:hypothetical protein
MDWYLSDNNLILIIVVVYDVHEHQQLQKYFILIIMIKRINLQVVDMIRSNIITFNIAVALHEQICVWILIYIYTWNDYNIYVILHWLDFSQFLSSGRDYASIHTKKKVLFDFFFAFTMWAFVYLDKYACIWPCTFSTSNSYGACILIIEAELILFFCIVIKENECIKQYTYTYKDYQNESHVVFFSCHIQ